MDSPSTKPILPPTTRTIRVSPAARAEWEPRFWRASAGWNRVERESVVAGLRDVAQQWISIHDYLEFIPWAINHQIAFRVVRWTGATGAFQHTSYPDGKDQVVVAFGRSAALLNEPEKHFGYPPCCVEMFGRAFPADVDPVLPWASRVLPQVTPEATVKRFRAKYPVTSPFMRYLGVRAIPHIACRDDCKESSEQAERYLALMAETGGGDQETREILGLPFTWDRYRGVAIITTPHFRVISTTAFFSTKEVVDVTA